MIRAVHLRTGDARQRAARMVKCACVLTAAGGMLCGAVARGSEKQNRQQPRPWVTMSLGTLGVPTMPPAMVKVGASMLTLDLVDDTHLLLTFSSRGLVPRVPDDPPDDEDRMVRAELVELPTGKILASKDWHMHDHARYLWRMGKGRFMVRSRHTLFMITPRALLNTADPLRPAAFPSRDGTPVAVKISPDDSMLTVETVLPPKKAAARAVDTGLIVEDPKPQVMMDFYRLTGGGEVGAPVTVDGAGLVRAPGPLDLPMDGDGYLWPGDPQHGRWPMTFNEFGGREVKIGAVDSSCPPRLQMVSRFEFLAFTCMGTDSRTRMKAYGMDGHETWEESVSDSYGAPAFAFAPAAGRFAISRISSPISEAENYLGVAVPEGATQEVRVYQTESGDLLLKASTSPVTRFAENFDLSEDGMVAAVVNAGAIEVYKLPPPSKQDVKDLELAKSFSPPTSAAPVRFAKMETPVDAAEGDVATANAGDVAGVAPGGSAAAAKPNLAGTTGSGSGGGGAAPRPATAAPAVAAAPAAAAPAPADAAVAAQGGLAGPSPVAELKPASATKDAADEISDEEAAKALGARLPVGQPATKAAAGGAGSSAAGGSAKADSGSKADAASADPAAPAAKDVAGGDADTGRRKPPTLLEPGEKVEKVKGSGQR